MIRDPAMKTASAGPGMGSVPIHNGRIYSNEVLFDRSELLRAIAALKIDL
jgi:hypothetical protein